MGSLDRDWIMGDLANAEKQLREVQRRGLQDSRVDHALLLIRTVLDEMHGKGK